MKKNKGLIYYIIPTLVRSSLPIISWDNNRISLSFNVQRSLSYSRRFSKLYVAIRQSESLLFWEYKIYEQFKKLKEQGILVERY